MATTNVLYFHNNAGSGQGACYPSLPYAFVDGGSTNPGGATDKHQRAGYTGSSAMSMDGTQGGGQTNLGISQATINYEVAEWYSPPLAGGQAIGGNWGFEIAWASSSGSVNIYWQFALSVYNSAGVKQADIISNSGISGGAIPTGETGHIWSVGSSAYTTQAGDYLVFSIYTYQASSSTTINVYVDGTAAISNLGGTSNARSRLVPPVTLTLLDFTNLCLHHTTGTANFAPARVRQALPDSATTSNASLTGDSTLGMDVTPGSSQVSVSLNNSTGNVLDLCEWVTKELSAGQALGGSWVIALAWGTTNAGATIALQGVLTVYGFDGVKKADLFVTTLSNATQPTAETGHTWTVSASAYTTVLGDYLVFSLVANGNWGSGNNLNVYLDGTATISNLFTTSNAKTLITAPLALAFTSAPRLPLMGLAPATTVAASASALLLAALVQPITAATTLATSVAVVDLSSPAMLTSLDSSTAVSSTVSTIDLRPPLSLNGLEASAQVAADATGLTLNLPTWLYISESATQVTASTTGLVLVYNLSLNSLTSATTVLASLASLVLVPTAILAPAPAVTVRAVAVVRVKYSATAIVGFILHKQIGAAQYASIQYLASSAPSSSPNGAVNPIDPTYTGANSLSLRGDQGAGQTSLVITPDAASTARIEWCSPPLAAGQSIAGTWTIAIATSLSDTLSIAPRFQLEVFRANGTIAAQIGSGVIYGTIPTTQEMGNVITVTAGAYTTQRGDYIVLSLVEWFRFSENITVYMDGATLFADGAYPVSDALSYVNAPRALLLAIPYPLFLLGPSTTVSTSCRIVPGTVLSITPPATTVSAAVTSVGIQSAIEPVPPYTTVSASVTTVDLVQAEFDIVAAASTVVSATVTTVDLVQPVLNLLAAASTTVSAVCSSLAAGGSITANAATTVLATVAVFDAVPLLTALVSTRVSAVCSALSGTGSLGSIDPSTTVSASATCAYGLRLGIVSPTTLVSASVSLVGVYISVAPVVPYVTVHAAALLWESQALAAVVSARVSASASVHEIAILANVTASTTVDTTIVTTRLLVVHPAPSSTLLVTMGRLPCKFTISTAHPQTIVAVNQILAVIRQINNPLGNLWALSIVHGSLRLRGYVTLSANPSTAVSSVFAGILPEVAVTASPSTDISAGAMVERALKLRVVPTTWIDVGATVQASLALLVSASTTASFVVGSFARVARCAPDIQTSVSSMVGTFECRALVSASPQARVSASISTCVSGVVISATGTSTVVSAGGLVNRLAVVVASVHTTVLVCAFPLYTMAVRIDVSMVVKSTATVLPTLQVVASIQTQVAATVGQYVGELVVLPRVYTSLAVHAVAKYHVVVFAAAATTVQVWSRVIPELVISPDIWTVVRAVSVLVPGLVLDVSVQTLLTASITEADYLVVLTTEHATIVQVQLVLISAVVVSSIAPETDTSAEVVVERGAVIDSASEAEVVALASIHLQRPLIGWPVISTRSGPLVVASSSLSKGPID